jgi:putative acetyltransferase
MKFEVRTFQPEDGPQAYSLLIASVFALGQESYTEAQLTAWTSRITAEKLTNRLKHCSSFVAWAKQSKTEQSMAGFASVDLEDEELDYLYVAPEFARKGVSRLLCDHVEATAISHGLRMLGLTASLNALPVYLKLGYAVMSPFSKTIDGVAVPCLRMAKELSLNQG